MIRFGKVIELLRNDYYEDLMWGLNGLCQVCEVVDLWIVTNTVVISMEQLVGNI